MQKLEKHSFAALLTQKPVAVIKLLTEIGNLSYAFVPHSFLPVVKTLVCDEKRKDVFVLREGYAY